MNYTTLIAVSLALLVAPVASADASEPVESVEVEDQIHCTILAYYAEITGDEKPYDLLCTP